MAAAEAGGREDTCYGLADPERFVDSSSAGSFRLNSPPRCEATTCGTDQPWPAKVRVAARQRRVIDSPVDVTAVRISGGPRFGWRRALIDHLNDNVFARHGTSPRG